MIDISQKRLGLQTVRFITPPIILDTASIVGTKENDGPLGGCFDIVLPNSMWGAPSWEKAESKMQLECVRKLLSKQNLAAGNVDYIFAGDLLNQCIGTSFGMRELEIPLFGLYGACSTMAESLSLAAMAVDGGFAQTCVACTSSHFCSAEKQYRFPLEYGGQRPPTSQWTVTGAGAMLVCAGGVGPSITHITTGKIVDLGICDPNNMGAAMAPSSADTIVAHFRETAQSPADFDAIITGDLGTLGASITCDLVAAAGYDISGNLHDCGAEVYHLKEQDVHTGGSGCGCSAVVMCGHYYKQLANGELGRVLFVGTGALLSPVSTQQGESIPGIAHAVAIECRV